MSRRSKPQSRDLSIDRANRLIALRVRRFREEAEKTQEQVEEDAGLDHGDVSEIELGARKVQRSEYGRLAAALGQPVEEVFYDVGSEKEPLGMRGTGIVGATGSGSAEVTPGDSG